MEFADDPCGYFGHDGAAAHRIDAAELARLQQQALDHRLTSLLPRIAPLRMLAEAQGLDAGVTLDRAPALFFPHTIWKSYDPRWLAEGDFARMTAWADLLTTVDLAARPVPACASIDDWLAWLEQDCGLDIAHSTGTTGRMSLVLRDQAEALPRLRRMDILRVDWHRSRGFAEHENRLGVIWPGPRNGRSAIQKVIAYWEDLVDHPSQIACLHHDDLGADYELYVVAARTALSRGEREVPQPTPYIEGKLAAAEARFARRQDDLMQLAERAGATMRASRVMLLGGPLAIDGLAAAAIGQGVAGLFDPQSFSCRLGGLKGMREPEGMEDRLGRFLGSGHAMHGYGMTELSAGFLACENGRYHVPPWIVPWVLDPAGGWQPKPRTGRQEGRAAFLDLATRANWGGLVTSDHLAIDYDPCRCGRTSPAIEPDIKRVEDTGSLFSFMAASPGAQDALAEMLR